jgi:DNA topoisomerase VI subunit B
LEVKHHPASVNDLLVQQLIDGAKSRASTSTLCSFLASQFECISRDHASRLCGELGRDFDEDMPIEGLTSQQV